MDDHRAQPIRPWPLAGTLARFLHAGPVPAHNEVQIGGRTAARRDAGEPLDTAILATLRGLARAGEPEPLRELLAIFQRDAPRRLAVLRATAAAGGLDALRRTAHTLRGSAASLGATKMAAACQSIEGRASAGELGQLDRLITELQALAADATAALTRALDGSGPPTHTSGRAQRNRPHGRAQAGSRRRGQVWTRLSATLMMVRLVLGPISGRNRGGDRQDERARRALSAVIRHGFELRIRPQCR